MDSLSAGMACDRLWRRVCVHGIASVRVEMSPWMSEGLSVVMGAVPLAWLVARSMWMELCCWCEWLLCVWWRMGEHSLALNVNWRVSGERSGMAEQCV